MKRIPAALALGGLLLAGGAFAAPPNAYQGTPEKENEAVKASQKTGQPSKSAKPEAKPEEKKGGMTAETFAGLELRNIGPAVIGGRIVDLAVDPRTPNTWYVAAASGGVWKTTNAGTTWTPDLRRRRAPTPSAASTIDPEEPAGGLGRHRREQQPAQRRLRRRRLQVDRRRQDLGERRAQEVRAHRQDRRSTRATRTSSTSRRRGRSGRPGGDRGLYKTTDGGKTWKAVLTVSENTGVTDVVLDPRNPDVLYAAAYQRRRHVWTLIDGGPEAAIYKSTDGGATWKKLSNGLPDGDMGRIGLAVAPVRARHRLRHRRSGRQGRRLLPLDRRRRQLGEAQRHRRQQPAVLPGALRRSRERRPRLRRWTSSSR